MATRSTKSKPWLSASSRTSPVSRTPHCGSRAAQAGVERRVARRRVHAVLLERPVEIEHAAGSEQPRRAGHQALRRRPWRNVDHVDRHHGVGARHRPGRRRHVELDRRAQVGRVRRRAMGFDARERVGIDVGRLPGEVRQVRGEIGRMLAGAARDLQHGPCGRQDPAQHGEDRIAVARDRGRQLGQLGKAAWKLIGRTVGVLDRQATRFAAARTIRRYTERRL